MPPLVSETIPEYVTIAGYAWAALMFVLGAGTIAVALTGDLRLWTIYVSVVLVAAQGPGLRHPIRHLSRDRHQPHPCRPRRGHLNQRERKSGSGISGPARQDAL